MVSYAAGSRYLSLIGGVCMSFYDWYCDLPPASPQVWGEQTDVPESADWYNSTYIIAWGSNVPQTRTPDAHFFTEVRYKGAKTVAVTPDYSEVAKLADIWMHPKQGTDAAVAMAMGHVILKEFYFDGGKRSAYFDDYARRYTDLPLLVMLKEHTLPDGARPWCPTATCAPATSTASSARPTTPSGRPWARRRAARWCCPTAPSASAGDADGRADQGKWNLENKEPARQRPSSSSCR
jgi:nitrate reductase alpha subunit